MDDQELLMFMQKRRTDVNLVDTRYKLEVSEMDLQSERRKRKELDENIYLERRRRKNAEDSLYSEKKKRTNIEDLLISEKKKRSIVEDSLDTEKKKRAKAEEKLEDVRKDLEKERKRRIRAEEDVRKDLEKERKRRIRAEEEYGKLKVRYQTVLKKSKEEIRRECQKNVARKGLQIEELKVQIDFLKSKIINKESLNHPTNQTVVTSEMFCPESKRPCPVVVAASSTSIPSVDISGLSSFNMEMSPVIQKYQDENTLLGRGDNLEDTKVVEDDFIDRRVAAEYSWENNELDLKLQLAIARSENVPIVTSEEAPIVTSEEAPIVTSEEAPIVTLEEAPTVTSKVVSTVTSDSNRRPKRKRCTDYDQLMCVESEENNIVVGDLEVEEEANVKKQKRKVNPKSRQKPKKKPIEPIIGPFVLDEPKLYADYKENPEFIESIKNFPRLEVEIFNPLEGRISAHKNPKFLDKLLHSKDAYETIKAYQQTKASYKETYGVEYEEIKFIPTHGLTGGRGADTLKNSITNTYSHSWVSGFTTTFNMVAEFVRDKPEFRYCNVLFVILRKYKSV